MGVTNMDVQQPITPKPENVRMHSLLAHMCGVACGKPYNREAIYDPMFDSAMENMKDVIDKNLMEVKDIKFDLRCLDFDTFIGCVYVIGKPHNPGTEPFRRIVEQRVLGRNTYYLFTVITEEGYDVSSNVVPINIKDIDVGKIALRADCMSRMLDYVIDCVHIDSIKSTYLHERDKVTTNDPVVIIAKTVLMYHDLMCNTPLQKYLNSLDAMSKTKNENGEGEDDNTADVMRLNVIDSILHSHMRCDWLPLTAFKSNEKIQVFENQIGLKEDIYTLARDVYSADSEKFYENYKSLFTGDIYKIAGYPYISKFLFFGLNTFSTEALNSIWRQYV